VIAVVWQFTVKQGQEGAFERLYGADGPWTSLSRKTRSFLGSSFLQELAEARRYLVVEYWSEMLVYEKHLESMRAEIEKLEAERTLLIESMTPLGVFNALNTPDRSGPTWSRRGT
jgi:hypothetical protein